MRLPKADAQAPTFRFHGHNPPKDGARTPILAEAIDAAVKDGVATMRLYDPVDDWGGDWGTSAKEFHAALDSLPDSVSEIRLHINSPGGQVFEAIAIMNALRAHPARVVAVVDGLAASAASFIAASADELVMGRNSELMVHDAHGLCMGNAAEMAKMADVLGHVSDNIASVYAQKSGQPTDYWRSVMTDETWFSADEAVAAGLADSVDGTAQAVKNTFDLSVFAHAGRADASAPPIPKTPDATQEPTPTGPSYVMSARHRLTASRLGLPG